MCFDISLLFGNKPLFVQLSTNKFGRLLTAHQHTAKDRPHAETTTHPIGSHTRNEQSRIDFLRIFYMIVSGSTCIPSRITGAQFTTTPATASLWNTTSSTE